MFHALDRLPAPVRARLDASTSGVRFARKPYFDDALLLFEILVQATGRGARGAGRSGRPRRRRRPPLKAADGDREARPRRPRAPPAPARPRLVTGFTTPAETWHRIGPVRASERKSHVLVL